jgi:hypothetical protein
MLAIAEVARALYRVRMPCTLGWPMCTTLLASALATGGFPCRWCHGRDGSDGGKSPDAGPFSLQTSSLTRHSALIPPCCTCLVTKHTHSHIEFPRRKCKYLFFARWCSFLCIYHVVTAMWLIWWICLCLLPNKHSCKFLDNLIYVLANYYSFFKCCDQLWLQPELEELRTRPCLINCW